MSIEEEYKAIVRANPDAFNGGDLAAQARQLGIPLS
jgi:hypothetical protein